MFKELIRFIREEWVAFGIIGICIYLFFLFGCAGWQPTPNAIMRRQAASELRVCIRGDCTLIKPCLKQSFQRCREMGLEITCGADELFIDPVVCK